MGDNDNILNCCRVCLDVEYKHVSILDDPAIHLQLRSCLAIIVTANDHLPKNICEPCASQLRQFYNFQINARCSQDWLESSIQVKIKKSVEMKTTLQPLPDSEYNSDSLLEFLNNTVNIEDYLNNLGKDDIPSIVSLLDRNEHANFRSLKSQLSPKKKDAILKSNQIRMEIDVLDSDIEIVKEIIMKEVEPKSKQMANSERNFLTCYGCKLKLDSIQKMCQHVSTCDTASRTCIQCDLLFDSRHKMIQHSIIHSASLSCNCGQHFQTQEKLVQHQKLCHSDHGSTAGCLFRCKECGETFKDRFKLYRHARDHIIKADEKKCDICGLFFIGTESLIKHNKKEHEKYAGTMYRCKVCKVTMDSRKQIYQHVKWHTNKLDSARHLCESCGKSFSTRAVLTRHSLLHTNTNHKCTVCSKLLNNQKERDVHMAQHSELTMCEKCGSNVSSYQFAAHTCE